MNQFSVGNELGSYSVFKVQVFTASTLVRGDVDKSENFKCKVCPKFAL